MVEDHRRSRKMLVLDSPKSNVFLSARNELIRFDRAELDCKDVEIAYLFGKQLRFFVGLDLTNIED